MFLSVWLFYNMCGFFSSLLKINDKLFSKTQLLTVWTANWTWQCFVALSSYLSVLEFFVYLFFCERLLHIFLKFVLWIKFGRHLKTISWIQRPQETCFNEQEAPDWTQMYKEDTRVGSRGRWLRRSLEMLSCPVGLELKKPRLIWS